jgi:hypothetical protein
MRILGIVALIVTIIVSAVFVCLRTDAGQRFWFYFIAMADAHDKAIVAIGTGFLAIFTIVLAVATVFLWSATRELVQEARDTAERQLRAYAHTSFSKVDNLIAGNGDIVFTIGLKNYGQTPAYKLSVSLRADLLPFPTRDLPAPSVESLSNLTLGPGSEHTVTVRRDALNQEEIADLAGSRALYVRGIIRYVDAFKANRFTRFSLIKGGGNTYPVAGSDLFSANEGNEAV